MEEIKSHTFAMEQRTNVAVTGVAEVGAFSETEIRLRLTSGTGMTITGEKLCILGFDKRTGDCRLAGKVNSLRYSEKYLPKAKRFFK